jgi:PAS domain S-box-containing protein
VTSGYHTSKEQVQIAQIETFLKDFGFNNREIAIYLALLKTKKAQPSEISKLANVERSDAYRILDTLVEKGFVTKILEKPVQYAIAPPEKAFKRNLEEKRRSLAALEVEAEDSKKVISDYIGKIETNPDATRFEVIKSRQYVYERLTEMFSAERCQHEILYYGAENSASRLLFNLKEVIARLPNRHIDFRIMLPITEQNVEAVKALSKFADIKHLPQTSGRACIIDRKESMLIYAASEDDNFTDDLALWLSNPQFAAMQAEMFDAQWKLALGLHNKIEELEAPPVETPTEENTQVVFTVDSQGKVAFLTPNINASLASSIQSAIKGLFMGNIPALHQEDMDKALYLWGNSKQGISGKNEFRIIKNGEPLWWSVSWLPLSGRKGNTETLRVVMKDITNIKKLESIERELIRSETLLAKGQEIAHLGSWELDHLTGRIYLSKEVYNIFGLDPKDKIVSFRAFLEIIAPNVNTHSNIQEMLRKNAVTSIDYEQKVVRKDGKAIVIHLKGEILRDETGRPIESFGMIHDITELKQVQQALIESNERYRLQFEEATDAIILADIETGMLLDCNKAALQLTGYAYNELIGKNQKELHPTLVDFKYHLKNPEEPVAQKLLTKSAQIKDVVIKASVMQLQGRNIMQGIFRDVTEEKRTEEAIKQTKQNYETFFDNIEDFLYVLDLQGNMLRINNTVTKRLGYTEDELIGKSVLMVHPPELRNEALLIVQDMISGKRAFCPIPVMAKDGSFIPVETRVTKGEWDGRPVLFGVSRDLSQLKLSEARFAQAFHANAILMALSDEKTGEFIEVNNAFLEALGCI